MLSSSENESKSKIATNGQIDSRIIGITDHGILDSNLSRLKKTYRSITIPKPSSENSSEIKQGGFKGTRQMVSIEDFATYNKFGENLKKPNSPRNSDQIGIKQAKSSKVIVSKGEKSLTGSIKIIDARKKLLDIELNSRRKPSDAGGIGNIPISPKHTFNIAKLNIKVQQPGDGNSGQEVGSPAKPLSRNLTIPLVKSYSSEEEKVAVGDGQKNTLSLGLSKGKGQNPVFGKTSGQKQYKDSPEELKTQSILGQLGGKLKLLGKGIKDGLIEVADKTYGVFSPKSSRRKIARVMDSSPRSAPNMQDKIEEIKKQNQKRERQSQTLTFILSVFDYFKLWIPQFMSNYSKLRLYNQVNHAYANFNDFRE